MTQRWRNISILTGMLATYVVRRILNVGPLRSWGSRVLLGLAIVAFILGGAVIAHEFMKPVGKDWDTWLFVYDLSSVSVTLLTLGVFLGLRVILAGSSSFLRLTHHLPVTQQERRAAMLAFEALALGAIVVVLLAAMSIAVSLILGPTAVLLAATPLATAFAVYLSASVAVNVIDRLLSLVGFKRARGTVLILLIFGFIVWFNSLIPSLVQAATTPAAGVPRAFFWVNAMPWVLSASGPLGLLALVVGSVIVLAPLALVTAPSLPEGTRRFLNVRIPYWVSGLWLAHLAYSVRNRHLWMGVAVGVALSMYLFIETSMHPLWAAMLLVVPGVYHYGNTRGLRVIHPEGSPLLTYARVVVTQTLVVVGFMALLLVVMVPLRPSLILQAGAPALGSLGAVVFSVLIGCVFPAEHDNPFSILIGGLVLGICLGFVGILTGLLNLPESVLPPVLISLGVLAAFISIAAVSTNEARSRHENRYVRAG